MITPEVVIGDDPDDLARRAAERVRDAAVAAIQARGRFTIALSGGSTPEKLHRLLAGAPYRDQIEWDKVFVFFGDERFVPPDDERSNYGMAKRTLLDVVPIPTSNVFPIPTTVPNLHDAVTGYTDTLSTFFGARDLAAPPALDLILLGIGDDGHTASLFPHLPTLHIANAWVTSSPPGTLPPPVDRVTMTFPLLNAAHALLFLAAGAKKAPALAAILLGKTNVDEHPAYGVVPATGTLTWIVDRAAASALPAEETE